MSSENQKGKTNILIVEDDKNTRRTLTDILTSDEGYAVSSAGTIAEAKEALRKVFFNLVIADLKLPDGSGLEVLREVKGRSKDTAVIIVTGYASLDTSISALNEGASSYIQKPLNIEELKINISRALKVQKLSFDNQRLLTRLKNLSLRDSHTGLYNHRFLVDRLSKELSRAKRYILPVSLLMLDIDYFKAINDVYGHQYGDFILKKFGNFLENAVRENDIVARYGGEEFIVLLPDTDREDAIILGYRLLEKIEGHVFDPKGKKIVLKVSIGVAGFPQDEADTADKLIDLVDKALRNAKKLGRNRLSASKKMTEKDIESIVKKAGRRKVAKIKEKVSEIAERADETVVESIHAFAKTIEARDQNTGEHVKSLLSLVTALGKKMKLSTGMIKNLEHAAILHDLGKVGISDRILHKKGKLTKGEYEKIMKHPKIGADIIRPIQSLVGVVPMILHHHERFDGSGYPDGLKGEEIPVGARIVAIADAYQALISDRPYRKAYSKKEAIRIIKKESGEKYDPKIVKAFLQIVKSDEF